MHFYFQGLSGFCGWIYNAYNDVIIKGLNLRPLVKTEYLRPRGPPVLLGSV